MNYLISAVTDAGIVRENNEDCVMVQEFQTSIGSVVLAVLCDGMGDCLTVMSRVRLLLGVFRNGDGQNLVFCVSPEYRMDGFERNGRVWLTSAMLQFVDMGQNMEFNWEQHWWHFC